MSISVHGLDQPLEPYDYIQQAFAKFNAERARRIQLFLDSGITIDRISIVTLAHCKHCHGCGWTSTGEMKGGASYIVTIAECPECPGVCVDRTPIVRKDGA